MKKLFTTLCIGSFLLTTPTSWAESTKYRITEVALTSRTQRQHLHINNNNVVATSGTYEGTDRAGIWDGEPTWLERGDNQLSIAMDINDAGIVVGYKAYTSNTSARNPSYWIEENRFELEEIGNATGINDNGQIVGYTGVLHNNEKAVIWEGDTPRLLFPRKTNLTSATDINNNGVITGRDNELGAYIYESESEVTYFGRGTHSTSINAHGRITGYRNVGTQTAFTTNENKEFVSLTAIGGFDEGIAWDINDNNVIVGRSKKSGESSHKATLWGTDHKPVILEDDVEDFSEWNQLTIATGINNNGVIVGIGHDANGRTKGFMLTPITPAPPFDLIVDNDDECANPNALWIPIYGDITFFIPGHGLNWDLMSDADDALGSDYYLLNAEDNSGNESFSWSFTVPDTGSYTIEAIWPANSNASSEVNYHIGVDDDCCDVTMSQQINGGDWNSLGEYNLEEGVTYSVTVSAPAGHQVIADAIRVKN